MPVSFKNLTKGIAYDRKYLAALWGYKGFQAIARGVVTPTDTSFIILFVTEEKQESLTQYKDYLEGSLLHWEGESKHASDNRIISAAFSGDEIHLFHRAKHHQDFVYMGEIYLEQHNRMSDAPSQFIFSLSDYTSIREPEASYFVDLGSDLNGIVETEKNALVTSRRGQGVFRDGLLRLWGGCAVTGYQRAVLLRASHIKPWTIATNSERLDPYNGLLLQPTIDLLFDRGYVTFDRKGKMIRASAISADELEWLGINPKSKLTKVPDNTIPYLSFHRENQFEKFQA